MNEKIKIDHLSYSSISRYLKCPAMFKAYITEKKPLPTEIQLEGRTRHAKIEQYLNLGNIEDSGLGPRLKNFYYRILDPVTAVEAEFKLDYITFDIVGRIDAYAIHGKQAVIVDFKGYPGDHIDELQLQIYALAVKTKHPEIEVIHASFAYIPPDYYEPKTYFEDDLSRLSAIVSTAIDKIAVDEKFEATPGPHCTRCEYVVSCPVARNFTIPEKLTANNISAVGNELYSLEALVDRAKAELKGYMVEHGLESLPVGTDGRYYLSTSTALRLGKMKSEKDKTAVDNLIELEVRDKPPKKRATNKPAKASEASASSAASASTAKESIAPLSPESADNIIAFALQKEQTERIKMSDLVEMLKQTGQLPQDATNAAGSQLIRELIGVPFISATEEQKRELHASLLTKTIK